MTRQNLVLRRMALTLRKAANVLARERGECLVTRHTLVHRDGTRQQGDSKGDGKYGETLNRQDIARGKC